MAMVVLVLLGVPISFVTEVNNLAALRLLTTADDGVFTSTQLDAQALLFLEMHRSGIMLAQVFWGLWMLPLSSLVFSSGFLPRFLGMPVFIAAAGYLVDSGTYLLFPGRTTIAQFTALGELVLPLWLLSKGVAVERWHQVALSQLPSSPSV